MARTIIYRRLAILLTVAFAVTPSSRVIAVTPEAVDAAIRRGVDYLYAKQTPQGNWERNQTQPATLSLGGDVDGGQWGGRTSLCTYALLAAGERPLDKRIVSAVEWLRAAKITGNYAVGMRANVWFNLPQTAANKTAMEADARRLRTGGASPATGLFDYQPGGARTDISCSQYGMLGCWAAAQRTNAFDVPFWLQAESAWCDQQNEDGGWSYSGRGSTSSIQMTAAGVRVAVHHAGLRAPRRHAGPEVAERHPLRAGQYRPRHGMARAEPVGSSAEPHALRALRHRARGRRQRLQILWRRRLVPNLRRRDRRPSAGGRLVDGRVRRRNQHQFRPALSVPRPRAGDGEQARFRHRRPPNRHPPAPPTGTCGRATWRTSPDGSKPARSAV